MGFRTFSFKLSWVCKGNVPSLQGQNIDCNSKQEDFYRILSGLTLTNRITKAGCQIVKMND
jgi:hypothetical protein